MDLTPRKFLSQKCLPWTVSLQRLKCRINNLIVQLLCNTKKPKEKKNQQNRYCAGKQYLLYWNSPHKVFWFNDSFIGRAYDMNNSSDNVSGSCSASDMLSFAWSNFADIHRFFCWFQWEINQTLKK